MADWTVRPMPSCGIRAPLVARARAATVRSGCCAHPAMWSTRGSPRDRDVLAPPALELRDGPRGLDRLGSAAAPQPQVEVDGVAGQDVVGVGPTRTTGPRPDPAGPDRPAGVEVDEPSDVGAVGAHEQPGRGAG